MPSNCRVMAPHQVLRDLGLSEAALDEAVDMAIANLTLIRARATACLCASCFRPREAGSFPLAETVTPFGDHEPLLRASAYSDIPFAPRKNSAVTHYAVRPI